MGFMEWVTVFEQLGDQERGENSGGGGVEVCLAHVSHMLQAIHLRRYIIHANSKL